jgi:hypothetical protein
MVYGLSSGQEKIRLNRNTEEMPIGGPWSLISITTANTSMLERIAMDKQNPNAEAQRIMEFFFNRVARPDVDEDRFNHALVCNHGVAGPIFIQYVLDNYDEVKKALGEYRAGIIKRFKLTTENRFWSAGLACILLGGEIAKRLGLVDYDMEQIANYMGKAVKLNAINVQDQEQSIEQILNSYVAKFHTGIVNVSGKIDPLSALHTDKLVYHRVVGRYEMDANTLSLELHHFKDWLAETQLGSKEVIGKIQEELGGRIIDRCTLTKGTTMTPVRVKSIVITNYQSDEA